MTIQGNRFRYQSKARTVCDFPLVTKINLIGPRPKLHIVGDTATSQPKITTFSIPLSKRLRLDRTPSNFSITVISFGKTIESLGYRSVKTSWWLLAPFSYAQYQCSTERRIDTPITSKISAHDIFTRKFPYPVSSITVTVSRSWIILRGVVVRASGLRSTGCEFDSWPHAAGLVIGWVTVSVCNHHL